MAQFKHTNVKRKPNLWRCDLCRIRLWWLRRNWLQTTLFSRFAFAPSTVASTSNAEAALFQSNLRWAAVSLFAAHLKLVDFKEMDEKAVLINTSGNLLIELFCGQFTIGWAPHYYQYLTIYHTSALQVAFSQSLNNWTNDFSVFHFLQQLSINYSPFVPLQLQIFSSTSATVYVYTICRRFYVMFSLALSKERYCFQGFLCFYYYSNFIWIR